LGQKSLWAATKDFQPGQLAVINEGLLRYLNFTQKAQVAQNVHALLEHFGGIWITPDITTRKTIVSTSKGAEYQRIQDLAGIDIDANSFRDEQQARDFFTQQGFRVTSRSYAEVAAGLVAPARAGLSPAEAQATLDTSPPVFVMSLI
jgi:O-methyltransferase involved in polyketide biosynthesis